MSAIFLWQHCNLSPAQRLKGIILLKESALRYLSYSHPKISDEMNVLMDSVIEEILLIAQPRIIHRIFDLKNKDGLLSIDAELDLTYEELQKLFSGCDRCMLIAGTLGVAIDRKLKLYMIEDMARYVAMDAAASALIEEACDKYTEELPFGKMTFRYGPGYGSVPLALQKQLLRILDAPKRIGLSISPSLLLEPQKSITGIVGVGISREKKSCEACGQIDHCLYRRNHTVCYQSK